MGLGVYAPKDLKRKKVLATIYVEELAKEVKKVNAGKMISLTVDIFLYSDEDKDLTNEFEYAVKNSDGKIKIVSSDEENKADMFAFDAAYNLLSKGEKNKFSKSSYVAGKSAISDFIVERDNKITILLNPGNQDTLFGNGGGESATEELMIGGYSNKEFKNNGYLNNLQLYGHFLENKNQIYLE